MHAQLRFGGDAHRARMMKLTSYQFGFPLVVRDHLRVDDHMRSDKNRIECIGDLGSITISSHVELTLYRQDTNAVIANRLMSHQSLSSSGLVV